MARKPDLRTIYEAESGPVFMNGIQALVRLPLMQRRLDREAGRRTAGLVSGYRGSPLGAYDQQLWRAADILRAHDVVFQPGLNEDLAATALWGAQMHRAYGPSSVDGVFGIWYGKGPGVDRSGDVLRAANVMGTSPLGGVVAIAGDDHAAQSSMYPHQTDGIFKSVMMPILQPASVPEILSLGLAGFALSRFSGLWVAMKTIAEVVESAATFEMSALRREFQSVQEAMPRHGLNWDPGIAWPAQRAEYERRLIEERIPAALAWARHNRLDRAIVTSRSPRICIATVGKAHQDVMQALENLGISIAEAAALGISVYKIAMSWPLDSKSLIAFAANADVIFVVEEKQPIVEEQLKTALYHEPADWRPRVVGKTNEAGRPLMPQTLEFNPLMVARAICDLIPDAEAGQRLRQKISHLEREQDGANVTGLTQRSPFFCGGCPHNTSTRTPDGSLAGGGIGCHIMALSQPSLKTSTFSQMGGEGAQWIGAAPFSQTPHIFQNMGDGTYQHSGLLAVRAAVAGKTPITFKILYNDAVAMTGGQQAEGQLDPVLIAKQLSAEGVSEIRLVSDDPEKWKRQIVPEVKVHHRDELDAVQRELRAISGVSAIIYEQTCAAEKRRRRKRGALPNPDRRLFINPRVCEGCGDCSVQSNCIAIEPKETTFGRKRQINQSACNIDFSCVRGFCPSFVEVDGAVLRKPDQSRLKALEEEFIAGLPVPPAFNLLSAYNIYIAGIGGLGVLTLGALLGSAAYLSGLNATVLDFTGLAQKNGGVVSQVRIAPVGIDLHAVRIGPRSIDLMIGADPLVAVAPDGAAKLDRAFSTVIVNADEAPTAEFVSNRDARVPTRRIIDALHTQAQSLVEIRASTLARELFGDAIAANLMLLGFAWQRGLLPVTRQAMEDAIRANGAAVEMNLRAFAWGRLAAVDLGKVERLAGVTSAKPTEQTIDELIESRAQDLIHYQGRPYARRYEQLVKKVQYAAARFGHDGEALVRAVAENAYKLMAYKDEYEVARLYSEPEFRAALETQFSRHKKLSIWLAPPLLSRTDKSTGRPVKRRFGAWIFPVLRVIASLKVLRGTRLDPFGYTLERRTERALVADYYESIDRIVTTLDGSTMPTALALARLPNEIRGFGPVKMQAIEQAAIRRGQLIGELASPVRAQVASVAA